ncbi:MAG: hypothetical protein K9K37_02600 [Desulfocapsa sp.]|nr:hypothetical protein [Desulfocapsa sp.]
MKKIQSFLCAVSLIAFCSTSLMAEEVLKWELIEDFPDGRGYNYSPNSIKSINGSIKEVYDGIAGPGRTDVRQLLIDCEKRQWAIGETKSYVNEVLVPSPKFNEDGWVWMPIGNTPSEKLVSIVCEGNKTGVEQQP